MSDPFNNDELFSVFNAKPAEPIPTAVAKSKQKKRKNIQDLAVDARLEVDERQRKKQKLNDASSSSTDLNNDAIVVDDEEIVEATTNASPSSNEEVSTTTTTPTEEQTSSTEPLQTSDASLIGKLGEKNACLHEVGLPPDWNEKIKNDPEYEKEVHKMLHEIPAHTLAPDYKPAKQYPFTLDAFQREAVSSIERNQSVLVSAHTSAGKTAVAEYAIALSLKKGSRVVYTSPIKALSNQKYRELQEEFEDVGLMTGDVTISPNASCIVMTTEILRSMLYRGSELLNEVAWVIFDEVHYMRDAERGVVWEETLVLLPSTVRYVFLSATIPNALEFAEWIAKLKGQPVHVVYTDYRPTPLQHYIFPSGGDGIHLVVDEKGRFREDAFRKAVETLNSNTNAGGADGTKVRGPLSKEVQGNNVFRLISMIMKRNYQPVIVFSFNRKDCESRALAMSKLDLLNGNEEEVSLVEEVFNNAIDALSDEDKKLPQVEHMLPLLKKGIGIHHSGLLPIIKEVIEILFQEGLVKVLFATETFAMGLNMPARTVLFTSTEKFDGKGFRHVTSGEYIQMSGRAGRRGIDDKGIVILMMEKEINMGVAKQIMSGMADALNSSFHLSYYMILNLLRVEEISPEYIMERSFLQFQGEKQRPILEKQLSTLMNTYTAKVIDQEPLVASYYNVRSELTQLKKIIQAEVNRPIYSLNFANTGRLVRVNGNTAGTDHTSDQDEDWGWGVIVNFQKKKNVHPKASIKELNATDYTVDVLLRCAPNTDNTAKPKPYNQKRLEAEAKKNQEEEQAKQKSKPKKNAKTQSVTVEPDYVILPVDMSYIEQWSSIRVYLSSNLKDRSAMEAAYVRVAESEKRLKKKGGIPLLDPIEDIGVPKTVLGDTTKKIEALEQRLVANPIHNHPECESLYDQYVEKAKIGKDIDEVKQKIRGTGQIALKEDLIRMTRVLRRMGCVTSENDKANSAGVITTKGRAACEISSADELVITELIFNGSLNNLTPEQLVALMSCLAFQEGKVKAKEIGDMIAAMPNELKKPYDDLVQAAKRVAKVSVESKMELNEEEYVLSFSPVLMNVTYAWCNGAKFHEICKMTEVFEGSIVRVMRRLEELLRQMCAAAKAIGEDQLEHKINEGINKLKRDIVFSSSLYL
jgi:ATP-dependent RNA helicase DOB1